jgi:hypothetical protein
MTGTTVKILIPRQAGGLIIGKGGATIRVSSTLPHRLCTYLGMPGGVDDSSAGREVGGIDTSYAAIFVN